MERSYKRNRKFGARDVIAIVVIVFLTALAVLFATLYAWSRSKAEAEGEKYKTTMENVYRKSYYGLTYDIDGLDTAISKLSVARTKAMKQEYLSDISAYSTAASENVSNLAEDSAARSDLLKFINQTGDFAKYLDNKLNKGGELNLNDKKTIGEIGSVVRTIKADLQKISGEVERDGFTFLSAIRGNSEHFSSMVRSFENEDIDYPSMIYDGPFSDSMTEREAKALSGEEKSEEEARKSIAALLPNTEIAEISVQNGSKNIFETYSYELTTSRGKCFVTLAKKEAFPVSVSFTEQRASSLKLRADQAENIAENYLENIGFSSMKAVWASIYNDVYYVNLAYYANGTIFYPDLVKVQVSGETGEILGMESLNYVFNHNERPLYADVLPPSEAVCAVSEEIEIASVRLAVVPTKGNGETLAYEIYGTKGEEKFFVYVSAESGDELKIMRVVDGERGLLLQ